MTPTPPSRAPATALARYARIECPGLWRPDPAAQRRDVVVSFGASTLVLSDKAGRPLTHWSLAAVARINPGEMPALFTPAAEATETLEIADDTMVEAVETVRRAVARARPRRGRVRGLSVAGAAAVLVLALAMWLPEALVRHAVGALPIPARAGLGAELEAAITRLTGAPCRTRRGDRALARLESRLAPGGAGFAVLPEGVRGAHLLPGGRVLIGRDLVEDHDTPEVLAGHVLAARVAAEDRDPLAAMLQAAGPVAGLKLLTAGELPAGALERQAVDLVAGERAGDAPSAPVSDATLDRLVAAFAAAEVAATPYARTLGPGGAALAAADPFAGRTPAPLLGDGDWVALQNVCAR